MGTRKIWSPILVVVLSLLASRAAVAQVAPPQVNAHAFQRLEVMLDSVSTDCEKAFEGAKGLKVTLRAHIENPACPGDPVITQAFPTFSIGGTDVTPEYTVTADPSNPTTLDRNGAPSDLIFWVDASPVATIGTLTVDGRVCVRSPTCAAVSCDADATSTDSWMLFGAIKGNVSPDLYPPEPPGIENREFGYSLSLGDMDGQPGTDLVVGAPSTFHWSPTPPVGFAGAVYEADALVSGASCPSVGYDPAGMDFLTDLPPVDQAYFGRSVASGDVDGDGDDDIIVGVPFADVAGVIDAGEVIVFFAPDFVNSTVLLEVGLDSGSWFGHSVAVGDFDGALGRDIAVGAPLGANGRGEVYIFYSDGGGGFVPQILMSPGGGQVGGSFGYSLAAGNVWQFAMDDLIVGAPHEGIGQEGRAHIFLDPIFGVIPSTLIPPMSPMPKDFGWTVAAGDADGDGWADVAVGDPTTEPGLHRWMATVYNSAGIAWAELRDPTLEMNMSRMSIAMGDIDDDGMADVIVGAPDADPCGVSSAGEVFAFVNLAGSTETRYFFASRPMALPEGIAWCGFAVAAGEIDPACPGDEVAIGLPLADRGLNASAGKIIILQ